MKKILFSLLALFLSVGAFAQGWVGETVQAGTDYYIYNVEYGHFIHSGNNWGTRATLDTPGLIFTAAASGNGFTLSTTKNGTVNTINLSGKFLGVDGYVDQGATVWTLTNVGTAEDPVYTMQNAGGKYLYMGDALSATWCDANADKDSPAAHWKFISTTNRDNLINSGLATPTNPVDVSYIIKDAGFINNSGNNRGRHYTWPGSLAYNFDCAERYHATFDSYQEVTVPNGKYVVELTGYSRLDSPSTGSLGTPKSVFYANEVSAPLMNIRDDARATKLNKGAESGDDASGYWPNNMEAGHYYFAEGRYVQSITVNVTSGKLKVGVKTTVTNEWVMLDNIKISYLGLDLSDLQATLDAKIEEASALLSQPMEATKKSALSDAITAAQNAPYTEEGLLSAASALTDAITPASASAELYSQIAAVNTKAAGLDAAGQAAYAATLTKYNNGELTTLAEAQEALRVATVAQTTPGSDFTGAIINPNFDGNINGWTDTFSGNLNHGYQDNNTYGPIDGFMECWAGQWSGAATPYKLPNGRLYQTIKNLPAGEYTLSADIIATQQQYGQNGYIATLDEVTGIYIFAESDVLFKSPACNIEGGAEDHRMSFTFNTTGGDTKLGLLIEATNCNWAAMDNVTLVYNGASTINLQQEALKEALAGAPDTEDVICNGSLKTALATAISNGASVAEQNGLTDEAYSNAYNALNDAINAVNASVEQYANTLSALQAQTAKAASLNMSAEFATAVAAIRNDYENRTMTSDRSAEVNGILAGIVNAADKSYAICSEVEDGKTYFIQNVGTGLFLGGANAWGTQASIIKHGIPFTAAKISDGVYKLDSHTYNGSATAHFFVGTYVDGAETADAANVTLENLGGNVYALKVEGKYVAANFETGIIANDADNADNATAKWKFISYDDRLDNLVAEYDAEGVADATWMISEANYSRNLALSYGNNGWEGVGVYGGDMTNNVMEKFHAAFDTHQTIAVPNGTYTLTVQGFYRADENSADAAYLYANDQQVALNVKVGTGYPNTMANCSEAFTAGDWGNTLENIVVTDNKLTIGVKTTDANNWVIWDNFELTAVSTPDVDASYVATAEGYLKIGDDQYLKIGGTEATEAGVTDNKSQAAKVTVTTNKAGISTILVDGGKYLMWNGEKMYVDGTILPAKATHKPYWTVNDYNMVNIQTGKYLGANGNVATLVDEATTAEVVEINYATEDQIDALLETIYNFEKYYPLGFQKGQFAPYTNVEYVVALTAAKAINTEEPVDAEVVEAAINALYDLMDAEAFVENEAEMNAVYDGTFAHAENDGAPAGWTMSNNTLGGALHARAFVGDDRLSEFNETNSGLFLRFDGTNSNRGSMYYYGRTAGYTMPLEENTTYYVSVDFAGWGSTGKPLRLNVTGPNGFTAVGNTINTSVKADTDTAAPQNFYIEFTTGAAGNYEINFQTPGADTNTHNVVISNVELYTTKAAGDVNADGEIDEEDVTALVAHLNEQETYRNADVNEDGKVSISDLTSLINYLNATFEGVIATSLSEDECVSEMADLEGLVLTFVGAKKVEAADYASATFTDNATCVWLCSPQYGAMGYNSKIAVKGNKVILTGIFDALPLYGGAGGFSAAKVAPVGEANSELEMLLEGFIVDGEEYYGEPITIPFKAAE